jgi:hypothetical protein
MHSVRGVIDDDNMKRWLIHNVRRQPSAAPRKWLL